MSNIAGSVAIICDQPMARAGLELFVQGCPGLTVGASVTTVEDFEKADYLVIVVELPASPSRPPLDLIAELATAGPPLVSSSWDQPPTMVAAVRAGARGLVTRYTDRAVLRQSILTLAVGGFSVAPELFPRFQAELARSGDPDLTPREVQTLRLVATGLTHSQIAARMGLSTATINTYVKRIRTKLGATNKAELARLAIELGHLSPRLG